MTPERKSELREQAAVMIAAAEGKEIEYKCRGCSDDDFERLIIIEICHFNWHDYEYRIKKVPTVKYIPFTAETFKAHRGMWINFKPTDTDLLPTGSVVDGVLIHCSWNSWEYLLEKYVFSDTCEPCGQKVEE